MNQQGRQRKGGRRWNQEAKERERKGSGWRDCNEGTKRSPKKEISHAH
jgi:hypothetical protein